MKKSNKPTKGLYCDGKLVFKFLKQNLNISAKKFDSQISARHAFRINFTPATTKNCKKLPDKTRRRPKENIWSEAKNKKSPSKKRAAKSTASDCNKPGANSHA